MKNLILSALLVLTLGACTSSYGKAIQGTVREIGKAEAAATLDNAIWWQCRASPIGAVTDRFGQGTEAWEAWLRLCRTTAPDLEAPLPQ